MGIELFDKEKEWRSRDGRRGALFTAGPGECPLSDASIRDLISQREEARRQKDWGRADSVRDELRRNGVELDDKENFWRTASGRSGTYGGASGPHTPSRSPSVAPFGANAIRAPSHCQSGLITQAQARQSLGVPAIRKLVAERERLRACADFEAADELRRQLANLGVEIFDNERIWQSADGHQGVIITGGHEVDCLLSDVDIAQRVVQREQARTSKDFVQADAIRDELRRQGVELLDGQRVWCTTDGRQGSYQVSTAQPQVLSAAYTGVPVAAFVPAGSVTQPSQQHFVPQVDTRLDGRLPASAVTNMPSAMTFTTASIVALVSGRERARENHDWDSADAIRSDMRAHGVDVWDKEKVWRANDGRSGTIVRLP